MPHLGWGKPHLKLGLVGGREGAVGSCSPAGGSSPRTPAEGAVDAGRSHRAWNRRGTCSRVGRAGGAQGLGPESQFSISHGVEFVETEEVCEGQGRLLGFKCFWKG